MISSVPLSCTECPFSTSFPSKAIQNACRTCRGQFINKGKNFRPSHFGKANPLSSSTQPSAGFGAARIRRTRRQKFLKYRMLYFILLFFAVSGFTIFLLVLVPAGRVLSSGPAASPSPWNTQSAQFPQTPTPSQTSTPSPLPTASPTAIITPTTTPIPPDRATATAWQGMTNTANQTSIALRTQYAQNYAATQTALPATVSALATKLAMETEEMLATARAVYGVPQHRLP